MATATSTTWTAAVRWARPAVAELVATIAALEHTEQLIECDCGASWYGHPGDPCDWCARALQRQLDDQKQRILYPDWMVDQGPVYDQLSDVDKAVWDRTRGIARGEASFAAWIARIIDATQAGVITEAEADAAMGRAERWAT